MLNLKHIGLGLLCLSVSLGCAAKKNNDQTYVVEEAGLNITKITDHNTNSVIGATTTKGSFWSLPFLKSLKAGSSKAKISWYPVRTLAISKDGEELAYMTRKNKQDNVMVRKVSGAGASTQRTFRDVFDFCWAPDDNIIFADNVGQGMMKLASVDAHKGSIMRQLTNNNYDFNPATLDGNLIFFTRQEHDGPMIWSYNKEKGELINCTRGYQPCPISDSEFLCTRNSTEGNSEIWLINFVTGQETVILSNKEQGYSNASLSPDGQWILLQANTKSSASKKQNLDLFVVRPDGSQLTQLTFHPENDFCPVWSPDGTAIYFLSSRGSKQGYYNIWKMNFRI